jgi:hypothetical protein
VDEGLYPVAGSVLNGSSISCQSGEDFWLGKTPSSASVLTPGRRRLQPWASPGPRVRQAGPLAGLRSMGAAGPRWAATWAAHRVGKESQARPTSFLVDVFPMYQSLKPVSSTSFAFYPFHFIS